MKAPQENDWVRAGRRAAQAGRQGGIAAPAAKARKVSRKPADRGRGVARPSGGFSLASELGRGRFGAVRAEDAHAGDVRAAERSEIERLAVEADLRAVGVAEA